MNTVAVPAEQSNHKNTRKLSDIDATAEFCGVTPKTIRNWKSRNLIPWYRIGRTLRFDLDDIKLHLDAKYRKGPAV